MELSERYPPRSSAEGGDFYDVFPLEGDRWALTIGDVVGKGPDAAALTGLVRYTLRAVAPYGRTPARTLEPAGPGDAAATAERLEAAALGGAESRDDVAILVLRVPGTAAADDQRIAISALSPTTNR